MNRKLSTRKLVVSAMLSAVSLILHVMEVLCKLNAGEGNPDPVIHSDCRMPEMVSWKSFAEAEKHS